MNTQAKISIVLPTYNPLEYLERCFNNITNQTFAQFECIIIDDGSTDGSGAFCDEYAAKDSRFRVIHQTNQGLVASRNKGLDMAQGEYVCFCDSDDWYHPQYLEFLYKAAQEHPEAAFVMCRRIKVEQYVKPELFQECAPLQILNHQEIYSEMFNTLQYAGANNKLIKLSAIAGVRYHDTATEDLDFNMRLYRQAKEFVVVPHNLYYYLQRPGSIVHTTNVVPRYLAELDGWRNLYNDYFRDESEENRSFILRRIYKLLFSRFNPAAGDPNVKKKIGLLLDDTLNDFKNNPYISRAMKLVCLAGIKHPSLAHIGNIVYGYYYRLKH